jgi:hypothetical protein
LDQLSDPYTCVKQGAQSADQKKIHPEVLVVEDMEVGHYARLRAGGHNGSAKGEVIGWENIELISDRPLETMLKGFKQLKKEYPDRILIASVMEEYDRAAWQELKSEA